MEKFCCIVTCKIKVVDVTYINKMPSDIKRNDTEMSLNIIANLVTIKKTEFKIM